MCNQTIDLYKRTFLIDKQMVKKNFLKTLLKKALFIKFDTQCEQRHVHFSTESLFLMVGHSSYLNINELGVLRCHEDLLTWALFVIFFGRTTLFGF